MLGCRRAEGGACRISDRKCGIEQRDKHPLILASAWKAMLDKPVPERVGVGNDSLIALVALANIADGLSQKPRTATPSSDLMREVQEVLAELPQRVSAKLAPKFVGVLFVENFGGTGLTQFVTDGQGNQIGAMILLDPKALETRVANEWITWRENTAFKPDPKTKLVVTIESEANNNRKNAVRYILLHEIAHVLSIREAFHPPWGGAQAAIRSLSGFPFARLSWALDEKGAKHSYFDQVMPKRRDIVFYFGAKLNISDAQSLYRQLSMTPFPTLYAATTWEEDFAESFVNYLHVVVAKRPFEVRIERDGVVMERFGSCWEESRCREKRNIIEAYLSEVPSPTPATSGKN